MKKYTSRMRRQYKYFYECLRQGKGATLQRATDGNMQEAIDCAILTYDYYDSHFSGWINRHRMHQFRVLRSGLFIRGELPF